MQFLYISVFSLKLVFSFLKSQPICTAKSNTRKSSSQTLPQFQEMSLWKPVNLRLKQTKNGSVRLTDKQVFHARRQTKPPIASRFTSSNTQSGKTTNSTWVTAIPKNSSSSLASAGNLRCQAFVDKKFGIWSRDQSCSNSTGDLNPNVECNRWRL